jgi:hypothetical protein
MCDPAVTASPLLYVICSLVPGMEKPVCKYGTDRG